MDWNKDGKHDLLAGDMNGDVFFYKNTGDSTDPVMEEDSKVVPQVKGRAVPEVNDWNEDGLLDLLVGVIDGTISIFINEGTDKNPVFNSSYKLKLNGSDLGIVSRAAPRIVDWNNDGLKDLLVGNMSGTVYVLVNVGSNSDPVFNTQKQLTLTTGDPLNYDTFSRVAISDWNNDGYYDLLAGGGKGKIMIFMGTP